MDGVAHLGLQLCPFLQVISTQESLRAVLATPAEDATPEFLVLALHLWPRLPADVLTTCTMLPSCPAGVAPPLDLFNSSAAVHDSTSTTTSASASASSKKGKGRNSAGNGAASGEHHSSKRAAAAAQFFTEGHLDKLGECLKLSSAATPHLHSVWPHILRLLLPEFALKSPGKSGQKRAGARCVWNASSAAL